MSDPPSSRELGDQGPSESRTAMVLAVIGVALLAAIVTFLILLVIRPPKRNVAASSTSTTETTSPATTMPSGPLITEARLAELTDELAVFVEQNRMLEFRDPPAPVLADEVTFAEAFSTRIEGSKEMLENLEVPFKALGLNPNGVDLKAAQKAFYGQDAVAFFDPTTRMLLVKEVPDTPYVSASLVAALTEQLDDQHFDVASMDTPEALGDEVIGLRSLVVGDGQRVASIWVREQDPITQEQVEAEAQARFGAPRDPSLIPPALSAWLSAPSHSGGIFTAGLVTRETSAPLDNAFKNPPDGSAQVTDPSRYREGTGQIQVPEPEADGPVISSGTLGSLILTHVLVAAEAGPKVSTAMSSYRGDTLVAWQSGGRSCIRMDISTGGSDTKELTQVISAWAEKSSGTVETVDDNAHRGQKLIRLSVCTPDDDDDDENSPGSSTTTTTAPPSHGGSTSSIPGAGSDPDGDISGPGGGIPQV